MSYYEDILIIAGLKICTGKLTSLNKNWLNQEINDILIVKYMAALKEMIRPGPYVKCVFEYNNWMWTSMYTTYFRNKHWESPLTSGNVYSLYYYWLYYLWLMVITEFDKQMVSEI